MKVEAFFSDFDYVVGRSFSTQSIDNTRKWRKRIENKSQLIDRHGVVCFQRPGLKSTHTHTYTLYVSASVIEIIDRPLGPRDATAPAGRRTHQVSLYYYMIQNMTKC
jgi:hypothetical protein